MKTIYPRPIKPALPATPTVAKNSRWDATCEVHGDNALFLSYLGGACAQCHATRLATASVGG